MTLADRDLESLLEEWARWATWPEPIGPAPATCISLESQYRSPQCWYPEPPRPREPDARVGEQVEAAWRRLDWPERQVLRAWYVHVGACEHAKRLRWVATRTGHAEATVEVLLDLGRQDLAEYLGVRLW